MRTDAAKLRQILINVTGNAIKCTDPMTVRLTAENGGRSRLTLQVADTGPGIRAEDQERNVQPFAQAGALATGGTGLGLAIALEIRLGNRSRSCETLPLEIAEASNALAGGNEAQSVIRLEPGQLRRRILVLEDHQENRLLLQILLEEARFQAPVAGNGAAAVDAFRCWRPHFIWGGLADAGDGRAAGRRNTFAR